MAKGWLIGGGIFLALLLAASIIVALVQQEEELPEGTPEAAVQSYLRAIEAEDYQLARAVDLLRGVAMFGARNIQ